MLINLTNHPSFKWGKEQLEASVKYEEIIDMEFPQIDAKANEDTIEELSDIYFKKILKLGTNHTVLCQGEMCFVFSLVNKLIDHGVKVISATSEREVNESIEGSVYNKISSFDFIRYREYTK